MKTIKLLNQILLLSTILWFTTCSADKEGIQPDKQNQLLSRLTTLKEQSYFDKNFIITHNKYIEVALTPRSDEELIDSLFNSLLELQLIHPFAEELISLVGYPIWTEALVQSQVDSQYQVITIPCVNVNDSLTRGIITSILAENEWHSYFVIRDTLYYLTDPLIVNDPNTPAHLIGMIYFDDEVFARGDSVLINLYLDFREHSQLVNNQILPRSCVIVSTTHCYSIANNNCISECPTFSAPEEYCDSYYQLYGCDTGSGSGSPAGFDVGGSIGSNSDGGGSGTGGSTDCGETSINLAYLCPSVENLQKYGLVFIRQYNLLLPYLYPSEANWLLEIGENDPEETAELITEFIYFINNYSNSQSFNQDLLGYYIAYLRNNQISHILDLTSLANLLSPYINGFLNPEETWIKEHPGALNYPNIEIFLNDLNHLNFGYPNIDCIDCLYSNAAVTNIISEILDANVTLDVCNPNNSTNSVLIDAISASCQSNGNITPEEFYSNLYSTNSFLSFVNSYEFPLENLNSLGVDFTNCCEEEDFENCIEASLEPGRNLCIVGDNLTTIGSAYYIKGASNNYHY